MATSQPARLPAWLARLPPRLRLSLLAGLLAIVAVWVITPTPRRLYRPADHVGDALQGRGGNAPPSANEEHGDIVNSIIVPSYNEGPNMAPLVSRIFQSLTGSQVRATEVLIIDDDSSDDTALAIEGLREEGYNVHLHVRTTERGLSSAVLHGFSIAHGEKLLVMDADLQHPPESVPLFLDALEQLTGAKADEQYQFALGTRYAKGYEMDKDWPTYRRIMSWGARMLSRPLTNAQDPMGGFFALRKDLFLASQPLNPSGFKIGLELLLKTPLRSSQLTHVPYGFAKRQVGSSKLGMKVILKYIGQLLALYRWRFGLFFYLLVGSVAAGGVYAVLCAAELAVDRLGWHEIYVGRLLGAGGDRSDKYKKRKDKWQV